jgi:asparagine synthase (glutamine-hydrolysing)
MCGIVGFNWKDANLIKELNLLIKHRGPDDLGHSSNKEASFGHRRLSILDLSKKGKQPMKVLHYTIVFNGEIYNFRELKEELAEYKFRSGTDTEVIVCAYDKWGAEALKKFNGMFAFCIYDSRKNQLFLARDRFGIKPLYYWTEGKRFAFCSEIKGLLPLLARTDVSKKGLEQFFNFRFTLGDTTLVRGVKKLLPGNYMRYSLSTHECNVKQYYSVPRQVPGNLPFEVYKRRVREAMRKAVAWRMVSDVPVAALLSGGIDSTIIATLAKRHNPALNTFSIGFDTTNELPFAAKVAKGLDTNHHEYTLSRDNVLDYLDDMVYYMDEPIGDPGFLPIFALSKEVAKHNKVVLSGDGGDEVFCGYDRYKLFHYGLKLRNLAVFGFGNDVLKRLSKLRGKSPSEAFFEIIRLFDDDELRSLGLPRVSGGEHWKPKYKEQVTNAQEFDIATLLPNDFFMKADKMSSAFGLEQRVPFMDHELVELAFSIPLEHKLRGWNEKCVLKEAFRGLVPEDILARRKHGFDVPIDYWFKNVLAQRLIELLKQNDHRLYDPGLVYVLLSQIKRKGSNYKLNFLLAQKLWSILCFEIWYERFIA